MSTHTTTITTHTTTATLTPAPPARSARRPAAAGGPTRYPLLATRYFFLPLLLSTLHPFTPPALSQETRLVATIAQTPVTLAAPYSFVEASQMLPDAFAQRARSIAPANRLIAWYVPLLDLKAQLAEKNTRHRSLQIQVLRDMEPSTYTPADLKAFRAKTLESQPMRPITEADAPALFALKDLAQLNDQAGGRLILGVADLGPDTFTICIASSAEGHDLRGGYEIESSLSCVTYILLNEKILTLTAYAPEVSAKELRNAMRLTRDWITRPRAANPPHTPTP